MRVFFSKLPGLLCAFSPYLHPRFYPSSEWSGMKSIDSVLTDRKPLDPKHLKTISKRASAFLPLYCLFNPLSFLCYSFRCHRLQYVGRQEEGEKATPSQPQEEALLHVSLLSLATSSVSCGSLLLSLQLFLVCPRCLGGWMGWHLSVLPSTCTEGAVLGKQSMTWRKMKFRVNPVSQRMMKVHKQARKCMPQITHMHVHTYMHAHTCVHTHTWITHHLYGLYNINT